MAWDIITSNCPYEPDGEFSRALRRVSTQEDVDTFEAMAWDRQKAVQEVARLREELAIWRELANRARA